MNTETLQIYTGPGEVNEAIERGEVNEQHIVYGTEHALKNLATELTLLRSATEIKRKARKLQRQNKKNGKS
jgi:hypothetical protein